ncbi:polysaccharide pyruvyl transferase family protein [Tautonia sp. JC769]|uniref:polysaccharide pyruvyl transferase family protein n=1 Tax=Tautonia sp. JC769 TaxID=3232135 RepID=UPI00345A3F5E
MNLRSIFHFGRTTLTDPVSARRKISAKLGRTLSGSVELESLLDRRDEGKGTPVVHAANFGQSNAGDPFLATVLRDLVSVRCGPIQWSGLHVHRETKPEIIRFINRNKGLIIGGGGLFLKDTGANPNSGWQWNCSVDSLNAIKVPIVVFAVGYNRFRNQPDFEPVFRQHLLRLAEKSAYLGLRNSGSIEAIKGYLPERLHHKVIYQPCMTTLLTRLYADQLRAIPKGEEFIAVNCAFDRSSMRFGEKEGAILTSIAEALRRLSHQYPLKYYSHLPKDEQFLTYLDQNQVPYELVRLSGASMQSILEAYALPALTIGMRGHAQMIPFGCGRPILSLISHDKLRWFLNDVGAEDWGIEVESPDLTDRIEHSARDILACRDEAERRIHEATARLWGITQTNLKTMADAFGLHWSPFNSIIPSNPISLKST